MDSRREEPKASMAQAPRLGVVVQLRHGMQRAVGSVGSTAEGGMICFKSTRKARLDFIFLEAQTKHTEGRLPHLEMGCYCLKSREVTGNLGSWLWWLVCLGRWHWLPSHCLSLFQRLGLCGLPARMDSGWFRILFPE